MTSLLPLLLGDLLEDCKTWGGTGGELGRLSQALLHPTNAWLHSPLRAGYLKSWNPTQHHEKSDHGGFKINLDVQQFKPEELKVKVVGDFVVVEAKHEERPDMHGYVSRQFVRRYKLPDNVEVDALLSKLSSDGVLTLQAPLKIQTGEGDKEAEEKRKAVGEVPDQSLSPAVKQPGKKQKIEDATATSTPAITTAD